MHLEEVKAYLMELFVSRGVEVIILPDQNSASLIVTIRRMWSDGKYYYSKGSIELYALQSAVDLKGFLKAFAAQLLAQLDKMTQPEWGLNAKELNVPFKPKYYYFSSSGIKVANNEVYGNTFVSGPAVQQKTEAELPKTLEGLYELVQVDQVKKKKKVKSSTVEVLAAQQNPDLTEDFKSELKAELFAETIAEAKAYWKAQAEKVKADKMAYEELKKQSYEALEKEGSTS